MTGSWERPARTQESAADLARAILDGETYRYNPTAVRLARLVIAEERRAGVAHPHVEHDHEVPFRSPHPQPGVPTMNLLVNERTNQP